MNVAREVTPQAIERLTRALETLAAQLAKPRRRAPPWRVQLANDLAALNQSEPLQ